MAGIIEDQVKGFPRGQREALLAVRDAVRELLPGAAEAITRGMPAFENQGVTFICFRGSEDRNSLFPLSASVLTRLAKELAAHTVSDGAIHFDRAQVISKTLLRKIIQMRIDEINTSYPRSSGEYLHFYANGHLQSRGRYRAGEMHGKWAWYRKDGSLMRSGQFDEGVQVGTWVTFDAAGSEVKSTRFP